MQVLPASHRLSLGLPSPTLTNPEMILPFDNNASSQASSPSMSASPPNLPSAPMKHEEHSRSRSMENKNRLKHAGQSLSPFRNGVLSRGDGLARGRSSSERGNGRIIYENSRLWYRPSGMGPIASSPTLRDEYNNAATGRSAESPEQEDGLAHSTYKPPSILEEDEDDPESHAAMTKRAEEILANAKRRLTNMEGNLNRARSTLSSRPSSSMSSFADREPVSLYGIHKEYRKHGRFPPLKHRQASSSQMEDHQGHARVVSETSVPSSLQTSQPPGHSAGQDVGPSGNSESANAASKERTFEPARNWFWNGLSRTTSLANRHNNGLEPLNEDGPAPHSFEQPGISEEDEYEDVESRRAYHEKQISTLSVADAGNSSARGLTRAKSTTQMRDLREQMSDLKGKITTLKQRAKEDSLKRRSLQSLRTPSPLNAAQQDYSGVPLAEVQNKGTGLDLRKMAEASPNRQLAIDPNPRALADVAPTSVTPIGDDSTGEGARDNLGTDLTNEPIDTLHATPVAVVSEAATAGATRDTFNDESNDGLPPDEIALPKEPDPSPIISGELGQQLEMVGEAPEVEDSVDGDQDQHEPVGERHEDRPDAFDYEHFFLHSSMGHYGRNRSSTHSSNLSIETERPAPNMGDDTEDDPLGKHGRQDSTGSVSSIATFATATEGRDDDGQQEWSPGQTMVGPWQMESPKFNGHKHRRGRSRSSLKSRESKREVLSKKDYGSLGAESEMVSPTGPPDILTYLASLASESSAEPATPFRLSDSDKELAERVIVSLAKVCRELQPMSNNEGANQGARICRRRLEMARRHLDGEVIKETP
ncbi:MAG: hypothetical protein Q9163_000754 [Psora crenata]